MHNDNTICLRLKKNFTVNLYNVSKLMCKYFDPLQVIFKQSFLLVNAVEVGFRQVLTVYYYNGFLDLY